jgi:hypothetical protein
MLVPTARPLVFTTALLAATGASEGVKLTTARAVTHIIAAINTFFMFFYLGLKVQFLFESRQAKYFAKT